MVVIFLSITLNHTNSIHISTFTSNSGVSPEKLIQHCKQISETSLVAMLSSCAEHRHTVKGLQPCLKCLEDYRAVSAGGEYGRGAVKRLGKYANDLEMCRRVQFGILTRG